MLFKIFRKTCQSLKKELLDARRRGSQAGEAARRGGFSYWPQLSSFYQVSHYRSNTYLGLHRLDARPINTLNSLGASSVSAAEPSPFVSALGFSNTEAVPVPIILVLL